MIPIPSGEEVLAFRERLVKQQAADLAAVDGTVYSAVIRPLVLKQQAADLAAVDGFLRLLSLPIATPPPPPIPSGSGSGTHLAVPAFAVSKAPTPTPASTEPDNPELDCRGGVPSTPGSGTEAETDQVVWLAMGSAMREAWFYLEPWWGAEDLWEVVRRRHPELLLHRGLLKRQLYCLAGTGELERRGQERPGDHTCYRASATGGEKRKEKHEG